MITSNGLMRKIGINMCKGYAKTELYSGVTTIRTVGGVADFDTKVRDLIEAGKTPGPRILAGNMAVSVPGVTWPALSPTRHTVLKKANILPKQ